MGNGMGREGCTEKLTLEVRECGVCVQGQVTQAGWREARAQVRVLGGNVDMRHERHDLTWF